MKKALSFLLVLFPAYLFISLYYLDKVYFLSPIPYQYNLVIRADARGDGDFGSPRNGNRRHQGIDLSARVGLPVFASRSGRASVLRQGRGMGNYIIINHAGSLSTLYGHLLRVCIVDNQFVRQGQLIGEAGKTGNANSRDVQPHLHFEVKKDGVPQDPMEYLP